MSLKKIVFTLLVTILCCTHGFCQLQDTTLHKAWYKHSAVRTFALPVVLIGYGVLDNHHSFSSNAAYVFARKNYPNFHSHLDDQIEHITTVAVYGLNFTGVKGKNNFANRAMLTLMSYVVKSTLTTTLKKNTHILRPDSSDYLSFPSGHTANAFVGAELMNQEFGGRSAWYSVAGYTVGAATGALRILNNKHWFSDVAAGAGIGILSVRLSYYVYPWIKRNICDCNTGNVMILPSFGPKQGNVTCVWVLR